MTASAAALLDELDGLGVHLYVSDGRLRAVAPKDTMSGDVRRLIERHREELIGLLRGREAPAGTGFPLVTERLVLRPVRAGDEADVLAYRGRADVCRFLDAEPLNPDTIGPFIAEVSAYASLDRPEDRLMLAAELDGRVIGDIALSRGRLRHAQGEIGWVFHPGHAGQGYATEAARAALRHGFEQVRLHRIAARLNPRNAASVRLCERLGMRREALLHDEHWFKGDWADVAVYAMLEHEWRQRP
jgi:RimJ/RimL family protein N-acetyltransferase